MYVCLCNGLTDTQIRKTVQEGGVENATETYKALGSNFCCGGCKDFAEDLVSEELGGLTLLAAE